MSKNTTLFQVALFLMLPLSLIFGGDKQSEFVSLVEKEIKRNFDQCSVLRQTSQEVMEPFLNAEQYWDLYEKKFVVKEIADNEMGGVWVVIKFADVKGDFELWLYEIDKEVWELRSIEKV